MSVTSDGIAAISDAEVDAQLAAARDLARKREKLAGAPNWCGSSRRTPARNLPATTPGTTRPAGAAGGVPGGASTEEPDADLEHALVDPNDGKLKHVHFDDNV